MVLTPHLLEHTKEQVAPPPGAEQRLTPVTTAGDEVEVAGSVIPFEPPRHAPRIGGKREPHRERRHTKMVTNPDCRQHGNPRLEKRETRGTQS
jgi:hypothetical protein